MKIEKEADYAVVSTTISGINCLEMRQMHELKKNIKSVLDSHKPDSKEKKYISDDDLRLAYAVFSVFTKEYESKLSSAFDEYLKEQEKPAPQAEEEKKPQTKIPVGDDQLFG